jgi:mono/diheme cytochrome c family protein
LTSIKPQRAVPLLYAAKPRGETRMRTTTLAAVVAALAWAASSASPAAAQTSPTARGQAIAERLCARCHAIRAEGASPMGLAPPFRDLPKRYPVEGLAEALAEGIVTGHPAMPRFTFEPREIDALLAYIASLAPPSPRKR